MRKLVLASLVALLVPTASFAQFQLGARVGYAPAMGDAAKDTTMKQFSIKSQIPIQIEGAYKLNKDVAIGAYVSYGIGQTDKELFSSLVGQNVCDQSGVTCSGSAIRVGAQGVYTFNQVKAALTPWVGAALGYEMASTELKGPGGKATINLSGFELGLQAGGDYRVNEKFAVGPYVMLSFGQYGSGEVKFNDVTQASGSIDEKGVHEWLSFGVRGSFDL